MSISTQVLHNAKAVVKYGARSTVRRWFDEYWTERDKAAIWWLVFVLIVFFIVAGPQIILWVVAFLPVNLLGNSGASLTAHQLLVTIATALAAGSGVVVLWRLSKPVAIELTESWIRLKWLMWINGPRLSWGDVTDISIATQSDPLGKTSRTLQFGTANNKAALRIPLRELESPEQRESIMIAFSKNALNAHIRPDVYEAMAPPPKTLNFAEVWLDALSVPPGRERLLPLNTGTLLQTRYEIIKQLGAGGQGVVYLAKNRESAENVVLKETILPVYSDLLTQRQALESFQREARALEGIKSDKVVKLLSSFVSDHRGYLVLQHIDGKPLSQQLEARGDLSPQEAVKYGIQMCEMLAALHNQTPPMLHRDFSPDNLLVDKNGKLTLIDFAVSVRLEGDIQEVAGKPSYMAPEQFKGKPTTQSDIYALGCTLFYILTGQHPDALQESHPIIANSSVPLPLSNLVSRCTKLNANERPADVSVLKKELEELESSIH